MISEIINLLNYKKVIGVSRNKLDVIPKNYFTNIKYYIQKNELRKITCRDSLQLQKCKKKEGFKSCSHNIIYLYCSHIIH